MIVDNDCSTDSIFPPISVVGLTLNSESIPSHGIVTITEIGTDSAALNCTTTLPKCCYSLSGENGWFFPDGSEVMNNLPDGSEVMKNLPYHRTRARDPGALLLHRNPEGTTTGIFRCDIPAASTNDTQSLYVGIYTSIIGESCTLSGWLVTCKEISSTPAKESSYISRFFCALNSI